MLLSALRTGHESAEVDFVHAEYQTVLESWTQTRATTPQRRDRQVHDLVGAVQTAPASVSEPGGHVRAAGNSAAAGTNTASAVASAAWRGKCFECYRQKYAKRKEFAQEDHWWAGNADKRAKAESHHQRRDDKEAVSDDQNAEQ